VVTTFQRQPGEMRVAIPFIAAGIDVNEARHLAEIPGPWWPLRKRADPFPPLNLDFDDDHHVARWHVENVRSTCTTTLVTDVASERRQPPRCRLRHPQPSRA
jgi:hypothetical protein